MLSTQDIDGFDFVEVGCDDKKQDHRPLEEILAEISEATVELPYVTRALIRRDLQTIYDRYADENRENFEYKESTDYPGREYVYTRVSDKGSEIDMGRILRAVSRYDELTLRHPKYIAMNKRTFKAIKEKSLKSSEQDRQDRICILFGTEIVIDERFQDGYVNVSDVKWW